MVSEVSGYLVHTLHNSSHFFDACLTDKPIYDHLIEDVPELVRVENKVDFAHVLKQSIEHFNENLNQIKDTELALLFIDEKDKRKSGVRAENDF